LLELLDIWVTFRKGCIRRIYKHRKRVNEELAHKLEAWEKIIHDIPGVASMIAKKDEEAAEKELAEKWGLSSIQVKYLMNMQIRSITINRANSSMRELEIIKDKIKYCNDVLSDDKLVSGIIANEQREIIEKYGKENNTRQVDELSENDLKPDSKVVSDEVVTIVFTNTGYVRRLSSVNNIIGQYISKAGDQEILRWTLKNNEYLLVFDRFGSVHKVLADRIDASNKAQMQDTLHGLAGLEKQEDIIWIDVCGDYSGYFNLVYPNGRGIRVYYDKASGNREHYKMGYDILQPRQYWITKEDRFFMITNRRKAAYCNITNLGKLMNRAAFKVANTTQREKWVMLHPYSKLPRPELIDLNKYNKPYPVLIGDDIFFEDRQAVERTKQFIQRELSGGNNRA